MHRYMYTHVYVYIYTCTHIEIYMQMNKNKYYVYIYNYEYRCALQQQDQCSTMHGGIVVHSFPPWLTLPSTPVPSVPSYVYEISTISSPCGTNGQTYGHI